MNKPWPADAVERRSIDSLIPYAKNSRTHSDEQVAQIAASMKEWGWTNPILIDETGSIIAGHGRVLAARKLGYTEAPVMLAEGWTKAQKAAYIIADNKLALNAGWDVDMLKLELGELESEGFALELTGFSADELKNLLIEETVGLTDEDAVPEVPETPVTVLGDVWILGNHRLMCGDSTSIDAVDTLMAGGIGDLLFTSPPYSQQRDYKNEISDWDALMNGVFSIFQLKAGAQVLVNLGLVHKSSKVDAYWSAWLQFMDDAGWPLFGWYVWDQGHGMPGNWNGRLAPSHEFVFHFAKQAGQSNKWVDKKPENIKAKHSTKGAFRQKDGSLKPIYSGEACGQPTKVADSVIRVNRAPSEAAGSGHPATFPVGLCEYIYKSYAKAGDVIYEPFSGAGTSIIACEKFGACCRAMELAPAYVDVAVKRWCEFTGKQATLESTGEFFPSIKEEGHREAA